MNRRRLRLILILSLSATAAAAPLAFFLTGAKWGDKEFGGSAAAAAEFGLPNDPFSAGMAGPEPGCDETGSTLTGERPCAHAAEALTLEDRVRRRCSPLRRAMLEAMAGDIEPASLSLEAPGPLSAAHGAPGGFGPQGFSSGWPGGPYGGPPSFLIGGPLTPPGENPPPGGEEPPPYYPPGEEPPPISEVPIPGAGVLLLTGGLGLMFAGRRRRAGV